jgi:CheY-like chemotaxis protein
VPSSSMSRTFLLLDLNMPGLNGLAILQDLKSGRQYHA